MEKRVIIKREANVNQYSFQKKIMERIKRSLLGKKLEGYNHKIINNDCSEVELKGDKNR